MQSTSTAYRLEMAQQVRPKTEMRVSLGVVNTEAAATARPEDNGHLYYSSLEDLVYERVPEKTYATFEPGRWRCDGRGLVPAKGNWLAQGFVSQALANGDGGFAQSPCVRFTFAKTQRLPALTLVFDAAGPDWPEQLRIDAYANGNLLKSAQLYPTQANFVADERFEDFDRLDLVFLRMRAGYRRARLQKVVFGRGLVFGSNELTKCSVDWETDPLSRRLPISRFEFSVMNMNGIYNPDNPEGIWRDIENHAAVNAEFLQSLVQPVKWSEVGEGSWADVERTTWGALAGSGHAEVLPAGCYYLTAQPEAGRLEARFCCESVLGLAVKEYRKGAYVPGGRDYYSLAQEVLQEAGLPPLADGSEPWLLWEGLRETRCGAPLPVKPCRELLQLLAHGACCVLYTDRQGRIRIEPEQEHSGDNAATVDFESMTGQPEVSKIETLAGVLVKVNHWAPKAQEREICRQTVLCGEGRIEVEFGGAFYAVRATLGGEPVKDLAAGAYYAAFAPQAAGERELVFYGREVENSAQLYSLDCLNRDENAVWEEVENPLITELSAAERVARWERDYLELRSTYSFGYRGSPEIDPLDLIYSQSRFSARFPAKVLKNSIGYAGTLKGKMTVKKMD